MAKKPKKKAKRPVAAGPYKVSAELRAECRAFMLQADNVQALYNTLFKATQAKEGLTNDVTGKDTGFVLLGGGCGFARVEGFRKTEKNKAILELCYEFRDAMNKAVRKLMSPDLVAYCERVGNPVQALQAQCEVYVCAWAHIAAEFMTRQGITGVFATSVAD